VQSRGRAAFVVAGLGHQRTVMEVPVENELTHHARKNDSAGTRAGLSLRGSADLCASGNVREDTATTATVDGANWVQRFSR
jgi:hypothetical protein